MGLIKWKEKEGRRKTINKVSIEDPFLLLSLFFKFSLVFSSQLSGTLPIKASTWSLEREVTRAEL